MRWDVAPQQGAINYWLQSYNTATPPLWYVNGWINGTTYTIYGVPAVSEYPLTVLARYAWTNDPAYYNVSPFSPEGQVTCQRPPPTPTPTTPTPTPTPTSVQAPWIKLSNASYWGIGQNTLSDPVPQPGTAIPYDEGDDDPSSFFIRGEGGLVSAPSIDIPPPLISQYHWAALYTYTPTATRDDFLSYVKSKREYKKITTLEAIDRDGVYVWDDAGGGGAGNGGNGGAGNGWGIGQPFPTLTGVPAPFNSYNVVLIVPGGTVTIDSPLFAPTKSVAILANAIAFSGFTNEAHGIFIASTVTTGSTTNGGLKIVGNLIHQSASTPFVNERAWADNHRPSLFVVFDPAPYLDLLPYLSTSLYQWGDGGGETPVTTPQPQ